MKINHINFEFPAILIDDYYSKKELDLIWDELNFITKKNVLYSGSQIESGAAKDELGNSLKSNYSIFLDNVYDSRNISNILTVNRKLFDQWNYITKNTNHWFYQNFECYSDFTLISYYENGDYYDFHKDRAGLTSLTWFYKEPKKFKGGDLYFSNENKINVLNNRMIIFPSMIPHRVSPVFVEKNDLDQKLGRFCITQFLHPNDRRK